MRGETEELNWLNVNLTEIPIDCLFLEQKIVDYRAKTGAGAYILTGWSRVKMERLHKIAHGRTTSALCLPKMIEILLDLWPDLVVLPPAGSQVEFYKKNDPIVSSVRLPDPAAQCCGASAPHFFLISAVAPAPTLRNVTTLKMGRKFVLTKQKL